MEDRLDFRRFNRRFNASLYDKLDFDVSRDIVPIAGIMRVPALMVVTPSFAPKTVSEFIAYAKANPAFVFKAGMVEGRVVDVSGISQLATLPSKEELFAKLLWVINAPAQQLVTAMNGVGRNLAVVGDQGVKENKVQSERPGARRQRPGETG